MNCGLKNQADYVSDVLDEIALEGLDGITVEALWMRLSVRPNFCFNIDENSKSFLWGIIIRMNDIEFYSIPEKRATLKYYNCTTSEDNQNALLELDEIYPYCKIKNVSGTFGSCQYYLTRSDISDEIKKMKLNEVEDKWGNKLVIVASQEIRYNALLGNFCNPNIDFSKIPVAYDLLERIGRSRYLGLATCGKGSIQSVIEDSKSIFHYLKFLYYHKLIKKQSLPGSQYVNASNASIVYLSRFFEECLTENMAILQTAIEELKTRPNYVMLCDEVYQLFPPRKKNKLKKFKKTSLFKKYIRITENLPYRTFFPDAQPTEWEKKSKTGERSVRCFQLINPDIDISDIVGKDFEAEEEKALSGFLPKGIYYEKIPIVAQALYHIKHSGALGLSQIELAKKMGIAKVFVRGLIKRLCGEKHCQFYIENEGRKRVKRYIIGENQQTKAAASELVQILGQSTSGFIKNEMENDSEKNEKNGKICLSQFQEENVSYRSLKRTGIILKTIKFHRVRSVYQIAKHINEEETKEGVTSRVDRGTIKRILQKLEKDELIKIMYLSGKDKTSRIIKVYTDPAFEADEQQKETLYHSYSLCVNDSAKPSDEKESALETEFMAVLIENLRAMKKILHGVVGIPDKPSKERELIYSPKFIRLNILHDFIFHLVYDYTGTTDKTQEEMIEELSKITGVDDDLKKELPKLYGTQLSPYMFVPPLTHSGKFPGWFLISDILIRMPLSVLVKMLKVSETCPELWKYLHHPVRKHFLVTDLPLAIRQIFFGRTRQIGSLYNEFRRLSFMGLLQFGLKFGRELYRSLAYLNRNASLLDTSTSPSGYYQVPPGMKFEKKSYYFCTKTDVKKYWMDMFNICMGTNLGVKANMIGKEIFSEREMGKESLKKVMQSKAFDKVSEDDDGTLPGDNLGAAGLDSVMFSFLRSNWTGPLNKVKEKAKKKKAVKMPLQKIKKDHLNRLLIKKNRRKKTSLYSDKSKPSTLEDKPTTGISRKVKERECRFKRRRKTAYDEIDLEALKLMNTLRVTWSTAEDNFLLICRVAMMFLCPNSRTFVRIPWVEVRKVLQANIPESRNKTQKAIARRVIYMLKNPTTNRSVNLCLEELKEMPEASDKFNCSELLNSIKPSTPNLAELQLLLYQKFYELVAFLKDRFINNTNLNIKEKDKDLIPDTLDELLEKFQYETTPDDFITVQNIRENVIRAVLMSSLSCRADKTSSAIQLFDIYRQYQDDELQNAIKKLKTDKVITLTRKVGNSIFRNGKILPLSFAPYKFSFAFQHMLNLKYPHTVYPESFSQINKLLEKEGEEFEVDLNECNIALFLLASKGFVSFRTIIPDQIIVLDSRNVSDATYNKILERYCKMLRLSGSTSKVVCSSGKIIAGSGNEENADTRRKRNQTATEPISSKKQRLEQEVYDKAEASEMDNSEKKDSGEDTIPETAEKKEWYNEKAAGSSRVILYIMREEAKKEANSNSGKFAQEFYVVNASKVMSKVDKIRLEQYSKDMGPKAVAKITNSIVSRSLVPMTLVNENSILLKFKDEELITAKSVLDFIISKQELGATIRDLNLRFQNIPICEIINILVESKIIIKSGIAETRFISQKYCTPWLLSSFRMTRLEREKIAPKDLTAVTLRKPSLTECEGGDEIPAKKRKGIISYEEMKSDCYVPPACSADINNKIRIILRPWIRIDGSLNRKVLDRFLGTILTFVMIHPGIAVKSIMKKFSPSITPTWTKELVEILFEIGCVTLISLIVERKANLFSKSVVKMSDQYTGLENDEYVAVEAKVDAVTILALFIGKKTYSKDFLVE